MVTCQSRDGHMPVTCQSCDQSPLTEGGVAQVEPVHPKDAKEQREGDGDIVVVPLSSSAVKEGDGGEGGKGRWGRGGMGKGGKEREWCEKGRGREGRRV